MNFHSSAFINYLLCLFCSFNPANIFADYSLNSGSSSQAFSSHYQSNFAQKQRSTKSHPAGKVNKPDPTNVHFLFENPRFINEPVCHASTKAAKKQQDIWWPNEIPVEVKLKPVYSSNTTSRSDFRSPDGRPMGLTRFSCIEGKRKAAAGIVPVTELPSRHVKTEKISYNHQFDSRRERRERGKLHGSFVWDTSGKAVEQKSRRFAKKHFSCSDSVDITTHFTPKEMEGHTTAVMEICNVNPHLSCSSKPSEYFLSAETASSNTQDVVKTNESKLAVLAFDPTPKSYANYTELVANLDQKSVPRGALQRRKDDSPPPHLC